MAVAEAIPQSAIRSPQPQEVVVSVRGLTKVFKDFWGRREGAGGGQCEF